MVTKTDCRTVGAAPDAEQGARTVGDIQEMEGLRNRKAEKQTVCIGQKRLPEDKSVLLADLNVDPSQVQTSVRTCKPDANLSAPCCPTDAECPTDAKMSFWKTWLTLWILLAVGIGIGVGQIPGMESFLHSIKVGKTNILTAVGMIAMLLPSFASVEYQNLWRDTRQMPKRLGVFTMVMNWIVGPFAMLLFGMAILHDKPELLQGVIYIGAARCIAMVLLWNNMAGGDNQLCLTIVLMNSLITLGLYAPVVYLLNWVADVAGMGVKSTDGESSSISFPEVILNVAIYLGIPFVIGIAIWATGTYLCERKLGWDFRGKFLPRFGPLGMIGLLWTIIWMFADMSPQLTNGEHNILDVLLVLIPLFLYFMFMFFSTWYIGLYLVRMLKPQLIAMAFTAASNNFELAIAVATGVAGTSSSQAVAAVMGPLVEIPVMLALVWVARVLPGHTAKAEEGGY